MASSTNGVKKSGDTFQMNAEAPEFFPQGSRVQPMFDQVPQTRDGAYAQTVEGQSTQPCASKQPFRVQGSMLGQPEPGQSEPGQGERGQIGPEQSAEPVRMQSVAPGQMGPLGQALIEQNEEFVGQQHAEKPEIDPLDLQEQYRDISLGRRSFSCPANFKDKDPVLLEGGRKFKNLRPVHGVAPAASPAQPAQTSSAEANRESGSTRARRASSARPIYKGYGDPRPARPMPKRKSGPSKWQPLYDDGTAVYPPPGTPGGPVSWGTHAHYILECTPCQFWYINRCRKGADCQYCHIKHTKFDYKRIRESKRTRDQRKYYEWYYGSSSSGSQSRSRNSQG